MVGLNLTHPRHNIVVARTDSTRTNALDQSAPEPRELTPLVALGHSQAALVCQAKASSEDLLDDRGEQFRDFERLGGRYVQ